MPKSSGFAVGRRVRVYPRSGDDRLAVIVEEFGVDGTLIFADTSDLQTLQDNI
jgi:hypothetical protein